MDEHGEGALVGEGDDGADLRMIEGELFGPRMELYPLGARGQRALRFADGVTVGVDAAEGNQAAA
jgi:hypothetical protein